MGIVFKTDRVTLVGERDPAGEEQRRILFIPGAIFMVAYQRESPAGKLDSNLMAAACMESDVNQ